MARVATDIARKKNFSVQECITPKNMTMTVAQTTLFGIKLLERKAASQYQLHPAIIEQLYQNS